MLIEVKVPQLSESVSEATLVSWHKKEGDAVSRDENLIDIETDKVVLETPAPADGVLVKLIKQNGDTVTSGELVPTRFVLWGIAALPKGCFLTAALL